LNFKITIILSIIAISIGAFFYYYTNYTTEEVGIDPPWFYQVSMDDINYIGLTKKEGKTIIPLLLYFNDKGLAKLSIGLGKGKKKYDKRSALKSREWAINKQRIEKNKEI